MYCRNCGEHLNDGQAVCLKCGVAAGMGNSFCPNCGNIVNPAQAVCLNCGIALTPPQQNYAAPGAPAFAGNGAYLNGQDKIVMALVCFFLGGIGIHNFMMGETKKGVMKIVFAFLCGISGILALIDFIKILMGTYKWDPNASF